MSSQSRIRRLMPMLALLAAGALAGCKPAPAPEAAQVSIGAAVAVDPAATITSPPGPAETAEVDAPVFTDDIVETGPGGALRVRFADSTVFSVGANARAKIDRFVFDSGRGASSMSVKFTKGAFRFVSGKPLHADPGQVPVHTPVASIGIRGTAFNGVVGPEAVALWRAIDASYRPDGGDMSEATLILLGAGAIEVDASGTRILLDTPGAALFIPRRGAKPLGPVTLTAWMRARIETMGSPPSLGPEPGGTPPTPTPEPSPTPGASATAVATPAPSPSPSRAPPPVRPTPQASPTSAGPTPGATPRPRPTFRPPVTRPTTTPSPRPSFRPPVTKPTATPRPTYRPPVARPTGTPSPRPTFRPPVVRPTARPSPRPTLRAPVRNRPTPAPTPTLR